jgi:hypothetical protein
MIGSWWLVWMVFMFFLVVPIGYGWGNRRRALWAGTGSAAPQLAPLEPSRWLTGQAQKGAGA